MLNSEQKENIAHWLVILMLVISGGVILFSLQAFINSFLGAVVLYVLFKPLMLRFTNQYKISPVLSIVIILFMVMVMVLIPVILTFYLFLPRLTSFFDDSSIITQTLYNLDNNIQKASGIKLISEENILKLQEQATVFISSAIGNTLNVLGQIGMMLIILYFLLINVGKNESFVIRWLPIKKEYLKKFADELKSQTYSNAIGMPLLAVCQGVVALIGYLICGLQDPFFWASVTSLFALLPYIGTAIIWLPAGAFIISQGNTVMGSVLIAYGFLVISLVDNIFRFVFQRKMANVHPLVTLLGVIMGLQLFGFVGLIFGPLIISYFLLLWDIYTEDKK